VGGEDVDPQLVTAWFCGYEPYVIHLNRESGIMPYHLYEAGFVDTVKHELGHHIIFQRCGTTEVDGPGIEEEGITNSYAVMYLEADREEAARNVVGFPQYATSVDTDAAAARIHAGSCREATSVR
jgi:hypothetical protein